MDVGSELLYGQAVWCVPVLGISFRARVSVGTLLWYAPYLRESRVVRSGALGYLLGWAFRPVTMEEKGYW
ncbi:MAG: hypothetical protein GX144_07505 [Clostridiaceae bacterium]|nr:hypothetical protein [Clostridiaceae bacterium]